MGKILKILLTISVSIIAIFVIGYVSIFFTTEDTTTNNACMASESMFIVIENTDDYDVVYHRDTKVIYAISDGGYKEGGNGVFTVLVNPDGTPMIYAE